ncbi:MAG: leucine-rich repeat domain-containing protein [Bacteroidales bacterium]|nr:leucine-rich repeat domain-containing protein [Bacteroidales bacterium]
MTVNELQQKLQEAYSIKNLNKISLTLINLYKNQQYTILQKIAEIISDFIAIEITAEGKGFSKLIMLYHPDRAKYSINEINRLAEQNNYDGLLEYSHILKLERIEEIANSLNSYEDIDYSPVYDWDLEAEGYSIINDSDKAKNIKNSRPIVYDFYDAVKIRQYGNTDIEFPTYYLEDIDEFELSSSDINDLDGVQYCKHAKTIDLSDNRITDLTPLAGLIYLEELNLSDNRIEIIDVLRFVKNLKRVYLSNNHIEDILPLLKLEKLDYVDLSGNKISKEQINQLIELGVTVDY